MNNWGYTFYDMKTFDSDKSASIILFNAPTKDEAKRVRRKLLEEEISESFGMSWDLKEGTDDYAKWVFFSDQTLF